MATPAETILLVEDEPTIRQLITTALTRAGYTVLAAANGAEGLELFEQQWTTRRPCDRGHTASVSARR